MNRGKERTRVDSLCHWTVPSLLLLANGCLSPEPEGLAPAAPAATTVEVDLFHKPLPELPLPSDLATRYDPDSATGLRINASIAAASTDYERRIRRKLDALDGWGLFQPITIPFTGPLDIQSILEGHRDRNYDTHNDVIYLINIDRRSPSLGRIQHLDLGNGNYPAALEKPGAYWKNDPRAWSISLLYEEADEDVNGNGVMDAGEDTDGDGVLDEPNYLPGATPARDDLAARANAVMTFYEKQTHTLIARPLVPLDERTRYAVVVTRRLRDVNGESVGSPFAFINHPSQTRALAALPDHLPAGVALDDIAFTWSFTTQSVQAPLVAVRDGLYGHGVQRHLGRRFPAELASIEVLRDRAYFEAQGVTLANPHLMYAENWLPALEEIAVRYQGKNLDSEAFRSLYESWSYVDFAVVGSFDSPQLFPREGADGAWLPFDEQAWPEDLDRKAAPARAERVYFTLLVPRKEISVRGQGQPAPLVIMGHGHGSNRFTEVMGFCALLCQHGMACVGIDGPSHGLGLNEIERLLIGEELASFGLGSTGVAMFKDRAHNQNGDVLETRDSGADFWTNYLFHTRDVVRQFLLDYMQLVRVVRSFDGSRRGRFDLDGDGTPELAGDFDGDGFIDIGAGSQLSMTGGSLGGIMSMVVGAIEPELSATIPISGGGGYTDIGPRSTLGGVEVGFLMRVFGPLYAGTLDLATGVLVIEALVPDLVEPVTFPVATVVGIAPGDTLVVENRRNGERGCGGLDATGVMRTGVASDVDDPIRILIYKGWQLVADTECEVDPGAQPYRVIESFELADEEAYFQSRVIYSGDPLVSLAEGLGLERGSPDLRRLISLGQLIVDPADPAVLARHYFSTPLHFPGTGQTTGAHTVVLTTLGDMGVPGASGQTFGRALGLIDYLEDDPRYGKSANQVLIDTYTTEGVHNLNRYTDSAGNGIHMDVENFSEGTDMWGTEIPRLNPPLRVGIGDVDPLGGVSAAIFPYPRPDGEHGFASPGEMTDQVRGACRQRCAVSPGCDPATCDAETTFDVGYFLFNMIGRYVASGGTELSTDLCMSRNDCAWRRSPPSARDLATLP